ncbi:MAG TPA: hypothetical protein P5165_08535 [Spirochaetia bacterium]|nr:hypothetical protein [Spirochaetia bacterium]
MKRILLALTLVLAAASLTGAFEVESLPLHLLLAGKAEAGPPLVRGDHLVLSAKGPYRFVAAAFDFEGYRELHLFERNAQGVFVLAFPIPLKRREPLAYRLVVDGTWMVDPRNPLKAEDRGSGLALSLAEVPYLSDERPGLYGFGAGEGRGVRFLFKGAPGEIVTLAGDFNNWDPFLHELRETSPGVYELVLPLPEGSHRYAFVYRGEYLADPLNLEKATSPEGRVVSVIRVAEGGFADAAKAVSAAAKR